MRSNTLTRVSNNPGAVQYLLAALFLFSHVRVHPQTFLQRDVALVKRGGTCNCTLMALHIVESFEVHH